MSDLYWVCETKKFVTMYQLLINNFIDGINMEDAMIDYLRHRGDMEHFFDEDGTLSYYFASLYLGACKEMIVDFLYYCLKNLEVDDRFCYSYRFDEYEDVLYLSRMYKIVIKDGKIVKRKKEEKKEVAED